MLVKLVHCFFFYLSWCFQRSSDWVYDSTKVCVPVNTKSSLMSRHIHNEISQYQACPWASCQIRKTVGCACAGNAGRFSRRRLQRKLLVSDLGMHHGTCSTHVPWCMPKSLTRDGGENVTDIPGACATCNFAYLIRGTCLVSMCCIGRMATHVRPIMAYLLRLFQLHYVIMLKNGVSNHLDHKQYKTAQKYNTAEWKIWQTNCIRVANSPDKIYEESFTPLLFAKTVQYEGTLKMKK